MRELVVPVPEAARIKELAFKAAFWIVTLYLIFLTRDLWLPLGLAFLIAMVLDPVVDRMEARGWSRGRGTIFIYASFLLIFGGLVFLSVPFVIQQFGVLQAGFNRYFPDPSHAGLVKSFAKMDAPSWLSSIGVNAIDGLRTGFNRSSTWLTDYGMRFVSNLVWVVIVPIVSFYALRDFHLILGKMLLLVPRRKRELVQAAVAEVTAVFARYLRGLLLVSAMNGAATWLLLWALHVPSPLLLGIVAGVLYTVPYLGAMITIAFTAAVAFVGGGVPLLTETVIASMILHQIVFDQIISPRVLGGHVGLHPILSIIALLAGNLLLGIAGMVLAVPVAACVQIAVLGLVPKLRQEISPTTPDPAGQAEAAGEASVKQTHIQTDATTEMHSAVATAVDHIEAEAHAEKVQEGKAADPA